jgi:phage-related protein
MRIIEPGSGEMKQVIWEGNSREILRGFPESVRRDLGTGLMFLQVGEVPVDAKPFKTGMPGSWELRARDISGNYRAIYVCLIRDQVHVLHCFKKTTSKTLRIDTETAQFRYKDLKRRLNDEKI